MHTVLPRKMGFDCVTVKSTKTESNPVYDIYRIQEYVLFGVSKKIKVTALYVTKVIYSVVIFML